MCVWPAGCNSITYELLITHLCVRQVKNRIGILALPVISLLDHASCSCFRPGVRAGGGPTTPARAADSYFKCTCVRSVERERDNMAFLGDVELIPARDDVADGPASLAHMDASIWQPRQADGISPHCALRAWPGGPTDHAGGHHGHFA